MKRLVFVVMAWIMLAAPAWDEREVISLEEMNEVLRLQRLLGEHGTAATLVEVCESERPRQQETCSQLIGGVVSSAITGTRCSLSGVVVSWARRAFLQWAATHPQDIELPPREAVYVAVREALGCK